MDDDAALDDPECSAGYAIPADIPVLTGDVLAIGDTFVDLFDGFEVASLMKIPAVLLKGLTQVICFVRRAGNSIPLLIDDHVVEPVYWLLDQLAVGTWGSARPPVCGDDHCLEIVQRSTGLWRSIFFPLKHLMFWDHTGPPLIDFCGSGAMSWKFVVPGLMSKYSMQSHTKLVSGSG